MVGHADERTTLGNYCFDRNTEVEKANLIEKASACQSVIKCNQKFNHNFIHPPSTKKIFKASNSLKTKAFRQKNIRRTLLRIPFQK